MKVTYEEIKVHLDLLQGSSIQSKRWMIETYLLLAPAEIALAINTNDDIESLIKEYNSEIETELLHVLSTLMTQCSQSGSYEYLTVTEAKDCPNNHHGDILFRLMKQVYLMWTRIILRYYVLQIKRTRFQITVQQMR